MLLLHVCSPCLISGQSYGTEQTMLRSLDGGRAIPPKTAVVRSAWSRGSCRAVALSTWPEAIVNQEVAGSSPAGRTNSGWLATPGWYETGHPRLRTHTPISGTIRKPATSGPPEPGIGIASGDRCDQLSGLRRRAWASPAPLAAGGLPRLLPLLRRRDLRALHEVREPARRVDRDRH